MTELHATVPCAPEAFTAPALAPEAAPEGAPASFDRLALPLRQAIALRGFTELTSVQAAVLAPEAEGRDLQISADRLGQDAGRRVRRRAGAAGRGRRRSRARRPGHRADARARH